MEIIGGVLGLVLLVAGIAVLAVGLFFWPARVLESHRGEGRGVVREHAPNRRTAIAGGAGLIALAVLLAAVKVIPAGSVGVVKHFGAIEAVERAPGINVVLPFATDIVNVETRVQGITFERLAAASREYQDVFLTGTLNVHVKPDAAAELYQNVGLDYADKIVRPFYANIVKEVVPQYGIADVLPKREEIRSQTVERLKAKLAPYGVEVDDVALVNVEFNEKYNEAIQDKQVQELRVQTEGNILRQKEIQAQQAVAQAKGEAEAQVERARGEAESNRLVGQSLTEAILQNRYIEKLAPNIQTILVPSGGNFLFDTKGIIGGSPAGSPAPLPTAPPAASPQP